MYIANQLLSLSSLSTLFFFFILLFSFFQSPVNAGRQPIDYPIPFSPYPTNDCTVQGFDMTSIAMVGTLQTSNNAQVANTTFYFSLCRPIQTCTTGQCYMFPNCTNSVVCAEIITPPSQINQYISLVDWPYFESNVNVRQISNRYTLTFPVERFNVPNAPACNGAILISMNFHSTQDSATPVMSLSSCVLGITISSLTLGAMDSKASSPDGMSKGYTASIALCALFAFLFVVVSGILLFHFYSRKMKYQTNSQDRNRNGETSSSETNQIRPKGMEESDVDADSYHSSSEVGIA